MTKLRPHQERVVNSLRDNSRGQVIVPTGGGKTMCMIKDAQSQFNSCDWDVILKDPDRKTIVIVAPRILLAQQLSDDFIHHLNVHPMLQYKVMHVHSGDTSHFSTTNPDTICNWTNANYRFNKLIFTTYHSLHKIQESKITIDTLYFDEAIIVYKETFNLLLNFIQLEIIFAAISLLLLLSIAFLMRK